MEYNWVICCVLIAAILIFAVWCSNSEPQVDTQIQIEPYVGDVEDITEGAIDDSHVFEHEFFSPPPQYESVQDYYDQDYASCESNEISRVRRGAGMGVGPGLYGSGRHTSDMVGN